MNTRLIAMAAICAAATTPHALSAPRTSADYSIAPDAPTASGGRSTSSSYTVDAALDTVAGLSTAAAPEETVRHGYAGQLYDPAALQIAATPTTVPEGGTRQLEARAVMDDETWLAVNAADVAWSVVTGPLTGIDTSGLATAALVYADWPATVGGSWSGFSGQSALTVLDTNPDNYGLYAGDGLDDSWQVQYFGENNPEAAADRDPDGDGQTNKFEFVAGLVPTDPWSRFLLRIAAVAGHPDHRDLTFGPIVTGRAYTVVEDTELAPGAWLPLPESSPVSDAGDERTVTDTAATEARKFYKVEITKP